MGPLSLVPRPFNFACGGPARCASDVTLDKRGCVHGDDHETVPECPWPTCSKVVVMMAQCTAHTLSMVCLGSSNLHVKGQRAWGRG